MPMDFATWLNCSRAAGRYTSVDTTIGRCPCCASHFANFPVVVVLPDPCNPTIIHTDGGRDANKGLACLPSKFSCSSRTIFTTCWSGESCSITSLPSAFLRIFANSSSATPTLTSPSSSASRISPSATSRCSSLSFPCPRRFLNVRCSRSVRFSNMVANALYAHSSIVPSRTQRVSAAEIPPIREQSDVLQMGIFEEGRIFQAVAQHAIESDMSQPDERVRNALRQRKNKRYAN